MTGATAPHVVLALARILDFDTAKWQYVYGKSSKTFVAFCLSFDGVQIEIEFGRAKQSSPPPLYSPSVFCHNALHTGLSANTKVCGIKENKKTFAGIAPEIFQPHKS